MLLWTKRDCLAGYLSERALKKGHFQPAPHHLLVNVYSNTLGLLAISSSIGYILLGQHSRRKERRKSSPSKLQALSSQPCWPNVPLKSLCNLHHSPGQKSSMTATHVSQTVQMRAPMMVRHSVPLLDGQKHFPNHRSGSPNSTLLLDF